MRYDATKFVKYNVGTWVESIKTFVLFFKDPTVMGI